MAAPEGIPGVRLTGRWLIARQPEAGQAVVSSFDDPGEALRAAGVGRTGAAIGMTVDSHDEERLTRLIARAAAAGQTLLTPSAAVALDQADGGDGTTVSRGLHVLADLETRSEVFQWLVRDQEELEPLITVAERASHLRVPGDRFVGRVEELERCERLIRAGCRLLTLTGAGGAGKSRLALHLSGRLLDRSPDGVALVELAALAVGAPVEHAVLAAFQSEVHGPAPVGEQLLQLLQDRRCLLILDNCEHLAAAVAQMVERISSRCPEVTVVATSRVPLRLAGERLVRIGPLPIDHDAEALLRDRADSHGISLSDDNETVSQCRVLCERLDGMPLAIELAAARLRTLSIVEVLDHLDDPLRLLAASPVPEGNDRHRGLQRVLSWSDGLLDDGARQLLRQLSIFAGAFDNRAVATVTGCADALDAAERMSVLVDHSLVQCDTTGATTRYRLLDTVRHFGSHDLAAAERDELRRRHAEWYGDLVRSGQVCCNVPTSGDLGNVRAAVAFAIEQADGPLAVRIVERLWAPLYRDLQPLEAEDWALATAAMPSAQNEPGLRWVEILQSIARLLRADFAGVLAHADAALEVERRLGLRQEPRVHLCRSLGLMFLGRYREGEAAARSALAAAQAAKRPLEIAESCYAATQCRISGDLDALPDDLQTAAALRSSSVAAEVIATYTEAVAATRTDPMQAAALMQRVAPVAADAGMHIFAEACLGYAPVFAHPDDPQRALSGLIDSLAFARRHPIPLGIRTQLRDFIPPLAALGADEQVAVFDGGSGTLAMDPRRVRVAIDLVQQRLGPDRYQQGVERGRSLPLGALDRYLEATLLQLGIRAGDAGATESRPRLVGPLDELTAAERRIAEAVAAGMSNREISVRLYLSVRTVESHLTHIYRKLGIRSRAQLVALALRP